MLQYQIDTLNRLKSIVVTPEETELAKEIVTAVRKNLGIDAKVLYVLKKQQMHTLHACVKRYVNARTHSAVKGANPAMRLAFEKAKAAPKVV